MDVFIPIVGENTIMINPNDSIKLRSVISARYQLHYSEIGQGIQKCWSD